MARDVDLTKYLPEVLSRTNEMLITQNTLTDDVNELWQKLDMLPNESYIFECSEVGIKRFEQLLGIVLLGDSDSLEDRRIRIYNLFVGDLPYTLRAIKRKIAVICGEGNFELIYDNEKFVLEVKLGLLVKKNLKIVEEMLEKRIPANILLEVKLLYNNHEKLSQYTHDDLIKYTHTELFKEVMLNV